MEFTWIHVWTCASQGIVINLVSSFLLWLSLSWWSQAWCLAEFFLYLTVLWPTARESAPWASGRTFTLQGKHLALQLTISPATPTERTVIIMELVFRWFAPKKLVIFRSSWFTLVMIYFHQYRKPRHSRILRINPCCCDRVHHTLYEGQDESVIGEMWREWSKLWKDVY